MYFSGRARRYWSLFLLATLSGVVRNGDSQLFFLTEEVKHLEICYNNTELIDRFSQQAYSLDSLLSLIEKMENITIFATQPIDMLARYLISRFRVDGIFKNWRSAERFVEPFLQQPLQQAKSGFVKELLGHRRDFLQWQVERHFTTVERCTLHWMLSHSVNATIRGDENFVPPTPPTHLQERRRRRKRQWPDRDKDKLEYSLYPTESGVMQTPYGTVAVGSVLAALALRDPLSTITLKEIPSNTQTEEMKEWKLQKLHAVTFGGLLAIASIPEQGFDITNKWKSTLGPRGFWNCSACPVEYTLDREASQCTDAEVFGAFDGYFLAQGLRLMNDKNRMKLSQILRMYYGNGFSQNRQLKACNRLQSLSELLTSNDRRLDLEREVALNILALGQTTQVHSYDGAMLRTKTIVDGLKKNFTIERFPFLQKCSASLDKEAEPLVDLYIVTDSSQYNQEYQFEEMASLVGEIANVLDIAPFASHMGIYVNDRTRFDQIFPLNVTMPEAELKCRYKRLPIRKFQTLLVPAYVDVLISLRQLFWEVKTEESRRLVVGTPSKVLLFVQFTEVPKLEVVWEVMRFRSEHPDVTVLGLGRLQRHVDPFIQEKREDYIPDGGKFMQKNTARLLYQRLQKVGSALYFPNCNTWLDRTFSYEAFVSPLSRRYHTMASNQFNASRAFRVEIMAHGVPLRVCYSRSPGIFDKHNLTSRDVFCREAVASGQPLTIMFGEPCPHVGRPCPPIHFMIEPHEIAAPLAMCEDRHCRTADTIHYQIRLHDAHCTSDSSLPVLCGWLLFVAALVSILLRHI